MYNMWLKLSHTEATNEAQNHDFLSNTEARCEFTVAYKKNVYSSDSHNTKP